MIRFSGRHDTSSAPYTHMKHVIQLFHVYNQIHILTFQQLHHQTCSRTIFSIFMFFLGVDIIVYFNSTLEHILMEWGKIKLHEEETRKAWRQI